MISLFCIKSQEYKILSINFLFKFLIVQNCLNNNVRFYKPWGLLLAILRGYKISHFSLGIFSNTVVLSLRRVKILSMLSTLSQALRYIPAGKGKSGRPKRRWKRSAEKEMRKSNWTCIQEMGVRKTSMNWETLVIACVLIDPQRLSKSKYVMVISRKLSILWDIVQFEVHSHRRQYNI